ncbi:dehydrogenase/reductase SDR family member 11-like isoform X3 [Saccostrea echinata]|uniref:dehydrogenase/reductase SDR family member 11-like isoform X3 n=1 Tax=Saccostrea echinata TaxID=191078 RepID=UPI002A81AE1E|nr:dehydrogenase/reductase SDR family member 11-like isoform X3 [Saccostrea echinata]
MERWVGRVALVTGASVGIGAAITRALVKHGMKVVGCARNVQQIEAIKNELKSEKGQLIPVKCDLTKEEEILSMFGRIQDELGGVDVCINNAGLAHNSPLLSGSTADWRNMLDVNVLALCICTKEAFQQMQKNKVDDGHIFLINSMSGHRVIRNPGGHFYSATKYAVSGLLEGIRNELTQLETHIRVTAISPGMVKTEFEIRRTKSKEEGEKIYAEYKSVSPGLVATEFQQRMHKSEEKGKAICSHFKCLEADDLADAVLYALSAPPHVQIHDILLRPTEQMS